MGVLMFIFALKLSFLNIFKGELIDLLVQKAVRVRGDEQNYYLRGEKHGQ